MHLTEQRPALPRLERRAVPQDAVAIPVNQALVLVRDPAARTLDQRDRLTLLSTPRGDVGNDGTPTVVEVVVDSA